MSGVKNKFGSAVESPTSSHRSLEEHDQYSPLTQVPERYEWAWLLWSNRRFLLRVMLQVAVLALVISLLIPNRYESTASFVPSDTGGAGGSLLASMAGRVLGGTGSALGFDPISLLGGKSNGALFVEILKSRTVQDRLIDKFDLRKVYGDKYYELARKDLTKNTEITEDKKSDVISLKVTDRDRQRAADIAHAYLEEMNKVATELNTSAAHRERVFIEDRLTTVKKDLDSAARDFSQFSSKNSAIDISEQGKAMVQSAALLQGQLIAAEGELKSLQEIYTPNNVRVKALQSQISELRLQLEKLGGTGEAVGSDSSIEELYPPIRKLPLLGVQYADLYRRVKIEETVFQLLTQQYEIAKIEEAKQLPNARLLDLPRVAERKSFPPRSLIVILSVVMALCLSAGYILLKREWDDLSPEDVRRRLAAAIWSDLKFDGKRLSRLRHRKGHAVFSDTNVDESTR